MNIKNREFMITNRNLNAMFKPNHTNGEFTRSIGVQNDAGMKIIGGKFNHQTAMIFDIIYDHMFRMFNQIEGQSYITGSLSKIFTNEDKKHTYFKNLLTDRKLEFYFEVNRFMKFANNFDGNIPFDKHIAEILNSNNDIIRKAFPLEFGIAYRQELENNGSLDKVFNLLKEYNFESRFFQYILTQTFYGKIPSWNNFSLDLNLKDIFVNDERTPYVLKNFFDNSKDLALSMSYPVTCFADHYEGTKIPKRIYTKQIMCALEHVLPFYGLKIDKSSISVKISLRNKFMAFFAHDAKLCAKTFIPSNLYSMNSNAFFIGKQIINNWYYSSKKKCYKYKLYYSTSELFDILNLPKSDTNGNSTHRKKAIIKALNQLNDCNIIQIEKLTSQGVVLKDVWKMDNNLIENDGMIELNSSEE